MQRSCLLQYTYNEVMATCLGWTDLQGCGECIIPLCDSYYISSLEPESILFICRELLIAIDERSNDDEMILMTKCYITCSGHIHIYKSSNKLTGHRLNVEYTKLVYIYTLCYWAAYFTGYMSRRSRLDIATAIITMNRMHDTYELWSELDKLHKMLNLPMLCNR